MKKSLFVFAALISGSIAFGMSPAMDDAMSDAQMQHIRYMKRAQMGQPLYPMKMRKMENSKVGTYKIEIDNDTKHPISVILVLGGGSMIRFDLKKGKEKKMKSIPRTMPLEKVLVMRETADGLTDSAEFMVPMMDRGKNIDIEIKMDKRTGRLYLEQD